MVTDIETWLEELGLSKYVPVFSELEVDMEVVADLTEEDLEKINIPLGPRKKLIKAINALAAPDNSLHPQEQPAPDTAPERRQLTVMFCDLVGSTALSEKYDPEDLSTIIGTYRSTCESVINKFAGSTARYLGDGIMVYFGYPKAHEDDAERGIRAALEIISALSKTRVFDQPLEIRIGIATGSVVVGEIIGEGRSQEHAIYGDTPNLAARLQTEAEPNTLVISDQTWQLAGAMFECTNLGFRDLKGFSEPAQLWQVNSEKAIESRYEATRDTANSADIIGREEEVGTLNRCWQLATEGQGQVVTISAEAGIGKSRLIQALRENLVNQSLTLIQFYSTPYHQNSALYPVISQLERAASFEREDDSTTKLTKLDHLLTTSGHDVDTALPLFTSLMSLPSADYFSVNELAPAVLKERILTTLIEHFLSLTRHKPVLVVFEDLHWTDPSTLELLERTVQQISDYPVLFIFTCRPEFKAPWSYLPHNTNITLDRLTSDRVKQLILAVSDGKPLPELLVESIVSKSDGTPLFVEEITKTVLGGNFLKDDGNRYVMRGPLPPLAVPNTLKDSLMARLNHTSSVKETAQIGAVIGRTFYYEMLAEISPLDRSTLNNALAELQTAELIFRRDTPPNSRYEFKHALVQDASYDSLLRLRKQSLHKQIAELIIQRHTSISENEPELLAHHFTGAEMYKEAVSYWQKAGQHAIGRSNYLESVNHCRKGLELLNKYPASTNRSETELALRALLGVALVATMGYAADEISDNYARAREICDDLGETPALVPALYGLWVFHLLRGHRESTFELANQLFQYQSDPTLPLVTSSALAISTFYSGDRCQAGEQLFDAMNRFDESQHAMMAQTFGDDADLLPSFYNYWNQWLCGYPDQAVLALKETDEKVERIGTPYLVATGMLFHMILKHELRDTAGVAESAIRFEAHSTEQGFPFFIALANIGSAWTHLQNSNDTQSIALIKQGVSNFRLTGARLPLSYWLHYQVQAQLKCGDITQGLETVEEALMLTDELLDDFYKPELLRLKGELILLQDPVSSGAQDCFNQALELSRNTNSKMLELRATMSLSRLLASKNEAPEARILLANCYSWFTEGFDTVDLIEARQLWSELS